MEKLIKVQEELRAPKKKWNAFGKYSYRDAESILKVVKPLLAKHGLLMTMTDAIVEISGRFYVVATVRVSDSSLGLYEEVSAAAREPEQKKGMDESQITGSTSSYARKYALSGMFLIDDGNDADSQAPVEEKKKKQLSEDKIDSAVNYVLSGKGLDDLKQHYNIEPDLELKIIDRVKKAKANGQ